MSQKSPLSVAILSHMRGEPVLWNKTLKQHYIPSKDEAWQRIANTLAIRGKSDCQASSSYEVNSSIV